MYFSLIVAAAKNRVIGCGNQMPWHLPRDLAYFHDITVGGVIIMGRKTWQSIGRLLPQRQTVIVSRRPFQVTGATVVDSLDKALALDANSDKVFVIGGGELFRQALPQAARVYYTAIHAELEGDTLFPELPVAEWTEIGRERYPADSRNPYACDFVVFDRL